MKHKVIKFFRRFFSCCIVAVIVFVLSFPASAADYFNYREFEVDVVVDGPNDLVTCIIPSELATVGIRNSAWHTVAEGKGSVTYDFVAGETYYAYIWPMPKILSLENIPEGATFQFAFGIDSGNLSSTPRIEVKYDYYEGDTAVEIVGAPSFIEPAYGYYFISGSIDPQSEDVDGMGCSLWLQDIKPMYSGPITITALNFKMKFSISSYYRLLEISGNSDALLDEVNRQLREQGMTMDDILDQQTQTNEKLDDIISGGAAGDDLIDAGDKIEDAGDGMGDSLDGMQDYEDQYTGEIDNYMADILAGADINLLSLPLDFVVRYINKIVEGIPRAYMVVFTLPMVLGILFFFAQHVVRAPRPDPTGDIVTRETFTTTEILEGRGKGRSTTTRTTTTSVITGIERGSG